MALELVNGKVKHFFANNISEEYKVSDISRIMKEEDYEAISKKLEKVTGGKDYGVTLSYRDNEVVKPAGSGKDDCSFGQVFLTLDGKTNCCLKGNFPDSEEELKKIFDNALLKNWNNALVTKRSISLGSRDF